MASFPVVLTVEAAATLLTVSPEQLVAELEAKRLDGFKVGDEWRTTEAALLKFMGISHPNTQMRNPTMSTSTAVTTDPSVFDIEGILADLEWQQGEPLIYNWPDDKPPQEYDEVHEAHFKIGFREFMLRVAFCTIESLGDKTRRRGVVFFMGSPLVEFSGENTPFFATTGRMASVVKLRSGQHLRPGQPVPEEYKNFPLVVYNQLVVGPYAAASMAVVAHKGDFNLMTHHALIRAHWKGLI